MGTWQHTKPSELSSVVQAAPCLPWRKLYSWEAMYPWLHILFGPPYLTVTSLGSQWPFNVYNRENPDSKMRSWCYRVLEFNYCIWPCVGLRRIEILVWKNKTNKKQKPMHRLWLSCVVLIHSLKHWLSLLLYSWVRDEGAWIGQVLRTIQLIISISDEFLNL